MRFMYTFFTIPVGRTHVACWRVQAVAARAQLETAVASAEAATQAAVEAKRAAEAARDKVPGSAVAHADLSLPLCPRLECMTPLSRRRHSSASCARACEPANGELLHVLCPTLVHEGERLHALCLYAHAHLYPLAHERRLCDTMCILCARLCAGNASLHSGCGRRLRAPRLGVSV